MQELQPLVVFTPEAREKIGQVLEQEKATDSYLKIEVYALSLEKLPGEADVVEEVGGLRVMAAKADAEVLRGSKIDFVESLQRTGFKIENPNVRSGSCGCGGH